MSDEIVSLDGVETLAGSETVSADTSTEQETLQEGENTGDENSQDQGDEGPDGQDAEDKGDKDEGDEDRPRYKKPSGAERLRRRLEAAEAELATLRRPQMDGEGLAKAIVQEIGPPPKQEDFGDDYLKFERAETAWQSAALIARRDLQKQAVQAQSRAQEAQAEAQEEYLERAETFRAKVPDFDAVITAGAKTPLAQHVAEELLASDKGPLLAYHLAKHPQLAAKLNGLTPRQAAKELGRLEATVSLPTPKTTAAKPPVRPLKGSAAQPRDPSRMSMDEYAASWRRRNAG